jgi:hypothetical protein
LLLASLFICPLSAAISDSQEVQSTGIVISPSPSPSPSSPNLALIPDVWCPSSLYWNDGHDYWFVDNTVTYNGYPSIREAPDVWYDDGGIYLKDTANLQGSGYRVAGGFIRNIKAGDHIVFKCWIKTGHAQNGPDGDPNYGGARLIIDAWIDTGYGPMWRPTDAENWQTDNQGHYLYIVPFGQDWTQIIWDVVVPSDPITEVVWNLGNPFQVTGYIIGIGPSFQRLPQTETANVWFADAELYINP